MASPASSLRSVARRAVRSPELPGVLLVNGTLVLAVLLVALGQDLAAAIAVLVSAAAEIWFERR